MKWLIALGIAIAGLVLGLVLSTIARRQLTKPGRSDALRQVAPAVASFLFWSAVGLGIMISVAQFSPESLKPLPSQLITYFPRVLIAGVLLIAGKVAGSLAALAVGRAILKATKQRKPAVERGVATGIVALAALVGIGQLGIDTTIVNLLVTGVVFAFSLGAALLIGLGGRDVARQIAAGRYLKGLIAPGMLLTVGSVVGTVVALRPATLELTLNDGSTAHMPNSDVLDSCFRLVEPPA